jgi:hypothetical protein
LKKKSGKQKESGLSWILYAMLAALIILYAYTSNAIIGAIALFMIIVILFFEVKTSIKSEGAKKSIIDIASAVGAAVVVWVVLIIVLQTSAPIDAVSSCSMLPVLHRGDLVILRGIGNMNDFISSKHVPVINVSNSAFQNMQSNMQNEFLAFFAYVNGNKSKISYTTTGIDNYTVGLYRTDCLSQKNYIGQQSQIAQCFAPSQVQDSNLIRYGYAIGNLSANAQIYRAIYTSQISILNRTLIENYSNPIIVYETTGRDAFSGSIIHRLYAILNVSGSYYFLTKGDNNQALDIEFSNYPINQSKVLGYVIAQVPLVGFVKLLLSGQITTPAGCNQVLSP